MPFSLKVDEQEARERLRAFWAGSSLGRPALHIEVIRREHRPSPWPGDPSPSLINDRSPAWHAWSADNLLSGSLFLAEAMPHCATVRC